MESSINLVSPKNAQLEKEQSRLRIARILALVAMFSVVAVAILVFVINLTLPINSIKQQESATLSNIAALHGKLVQYYLIEDRVNHISNIIAQRGQLPSTVDTLLAIVPGELSVNLLQIDAQHVSFDVSGASLVPMNKFIDDITLLGTQKNILKNVVIQQLSLDVKDSKYTISVQADLK
jgi:hypothetical protein